MSDDCTCRDCAGDPCLCSLGDHCEWNAAATYCRCCGDTNYRWLGYLGYVARMAQRWGVSKEEAAQRMDALAEVELAAIGGAE